MALTIGQSNDVVTVARFLAVPDERTEAAFCGALRRLLDAAGKSLQVSSTSLLSDDDIEAAAARLLPIERSTT